MYRVLRCPSSFPETSGVYTCCIGASTSRHSSLTVDADDGGGPDAKIRALALLKMQQQAMHPQDAPASAQQVVEPPHTLAQSSAPQDGEHVYQEGDEFADDGDTWAADHDERDINQFEADGQNFSHELQADELHWENESFAKNLPPGWANCPNSGKMLMGMLPIKVL
jgi:hypothetical protein